ncbi:MAG: NAD-dependent epimerase/dehydratase family protein [Thalassotalea sp.]
MKKENLGPVCVLGATGFVGSAITDSLEQQNIDWIGTSRFENDNPRIHSVSLDQQAKLVELLTDYPTVINAMGSFKPADFEQNTKSVFQCFWDNLQLLSQILAASPVEKMIHISSGGTVYGDTHGVPAKETDWLKPISWYGKAKAIEESILEKAALQSGFDYKCARVTNPFGNSNFSTHGFIDVLINTIKNGGVFNTYSNPLYSRDFIHCDDMAKSILSIAIEKQREPVDIYNVGKGRSTRFVDILNLAKEIAPSLEYQLERLDTDFDVIQSNVNTSKLNALNIETEKFESIKNYLIRKL